MLSIPIGPLLERLAASRTQDSVLVTDADGTLWSGDVGHDAFGALLARRALREAARPAFDAIAAAHGFPTAAPLPTTGELLLAAYEAGRLSDDDAYRMMALGFSGFSEAEARAFVQPLQAELDDRLLPEMLAVVAWAVENGVPVYIASASPRFVVEEAVARCKLPVAGVFGVELLGEGEFDGRIGEPMPYGPGKVEVVRRRLPGAHVLGAFGDSAFDADLLRMAAHPCAVRPKKRLLEVSESIPGSVRLLPGDG